MNGPSGSRSRRRLTSISMGIVLAGALPGSAATQDRTGVVSSMEVLFENEYVRVQWHDVRVGETVPMHSHPAAVVLAFSSSEVNFTFPDGTTRPARAAAGQAYWNRAASHAVENAGDVPVHNLMVEMKAQAPDLAPPRPWNTDVLPLEAAPEQHTVLIDNERVRVMRVVSRPNSTGAPHVHQWPSLFITVSPARLLLRDSEGRVVLEAPGITEGEDLPRVQWFSPSAAPRSVENADTTELRAFRIEIKGDPTP